MDYWVGVGGGGGQRVCWPPYQIIGGPAPPPLPTPMHTNVSGVCCASSVNNRKQLFQTSSIKPWTYGSFTSSDLHLPLSAWPRLAKSHCEFVLGGSYI